MVRERLWKYLQCSLQIYAKQTFVSQYFWPKKGMDIWTESEYPSGVFLIRILYVSMGFARADQMRPWHILLRLIVCPCISWKGPFHMKVHNVRHHLDTYPNLSSKQDSGDSVFVKAQVRDTYTFISGDWPWKRQLKTSSFICFLVTAPWRTCQPKAFWATSVPLCWNGLPCPYLQNYTAEPESCVNEDDQVTVERKRSK